MVGGFKKQQSDVVQGNELGYWADLGSVSSFTAQKLCDLGKVEQPL